MRPRYAFFWLLAVIQIWCAHAIGFFIHEYAHSFAAWLAHYKANPLAINGHLNLNNILWQADIDENVDYAPIFADGHGPLASLIAVAGVLIGNGISYIASRLLYAKARQRKMQAWAMFFFWICVMSVGNFLCYVPIRTFATHADMATTAKGLNISPWLIAFGLGIPFAVALWHFFAKILPDAREFLFPESRLSQWVFVLLTTFLVFVFFGSAGVRGYGRPSHWLSVLSEFILFPVVTFLCWPRRRQDLMPPKHTGRNDALSSSTECVRHWLCSDSFTMRPTYTCLLALFCCSLSIAAHGQSSLTVNDISADMRAKIDATAQHALDQTGVPSASVAIVQGGKIVYTHAYDKAKLDPPVPAEPSMRYSVGSISKQFTAAAILLLEQQGKLSIDDPVSKYLPDLTRANEVTIRMLLSHTAGYQDFWPEDYLMPPMREATTAQHILDTWAKKPLDFDPGTRWQYSNTNYVIAGLIVEKVSGMPLMKFLQANVFKPLDMAAVWNSDAERLGDTDASGYIRYALGPLRPAPKEGKGWMFAAGELAMPAYDLAQWNISIMNRSLLAAKSYDEMFDAVKLKDGTDSHYGLGLFVRKAFGRKLYEHSGEVSGFVSENMVFPDDKAAIVVLTNQDAARAAGIIGRELAPIVLGVDTQAPNEAERQALEIYIGLMQGKIDRALFTPNCNAYFSQQALEDFQSSLSPLGKPTALKKTTEELRGGMTFRVFSVILPNSKQSLQVTTYTMPDGKLEQYLVIPG